MNDKQNRDYVRGILDTLAFAPAYLDTLASTPHLDGTPHLDRLRVVAESIADLTDRVPMLLSVDGFSAERERAMLEEQSRLRSEIARLTEELKEKTAQIASDNNEILDLRSAIKSAMAAPRRVYVVLDELGRRLQVFGSKNNAESYARGYGNDATVATWDIIT